MHCCGMISPADWKNSLPSSCCGDNEVKCELKSVHLYKDGCVNIVTDYVLFWNSIIGYASVAIGAFEVRKIYFCKICIVYNTLVYLWLHNPCP